MEQLVIRITLILAILCYSTVSNKEHLQSGDPILLNKEQLVIRTTLILAILYYLIRNR